jgi:hypothetical protein
MSALAILWTLWGKAANAESALSQWSHTAGVERHRVWMTGLLVGAPLLIGRTVSFAHNLANEGAGWSAGRAASRLAIIASSWAGAVIAAGAWITLIAVAAEFGSRASDRAPLQPAGRALLSSLSSDQDGVVIFKVQAPTDHDATTLRLPVGLIATGGPSAKLKTRFTRIESGDFIEEEVLVATKQPLEAQVPDGAGALRLSLERVGEGALVVVPAERAEWWRPAGSTLKASLMLGLLVCMISSAMLAAALGLGTWMRPAAATTLLFAIGIALWFSDGALGGWGEIMDHIANGDAPAGPSLLGQGGTLLTISAGAFLACTGLRGGRRT